jgi:ArsR family transcriptional regulator, arsenate/arsenite/antimonite-responsive transcriptional repressor
MLHHGNFYYFFLLQFRKQFSLLWLILRLIEYCIASGMQKLYNTYEVILMFESAVQEFVRALASEKRQEILFLYMKHHELTVNEVAEYVNVGQSTASEHLSYLKRAGILMSKKEGKAVIYYPNKERIAYSLDSLSSYLRNCCK